ncbi:hypothetical protein B7486_66565 [cyanobacterium TDX16]|nr:hypothetical protein B7486_66565 [cyanobacterium TDX16]
MYGSNVNPTTAGGAVVGTLAYTGYTTARDMLIGCSLVLLGFLCLRLGVILNRRSAAAEG